MFILCVRASVCLLCECVYCVTVCEFVCVRVCVYCECVCVRASVCVFIV